MTPLYEDNHLIIVSKDAGEIVQGDKTRDIPLSDIVKTYLKEKHNKPGNVFLGVVHRLDRPTTGIVVFAKTSKALTRLNEMFRRNEVRKTYYALVRTANGLPPIGETRSLEHWLTRNERQNKSYAHSSEKPHSKHALLDYTPLRTSERYTLLEVQLHTGRHHQIRCQLASIGYPLHGDLKYGAPRSNPDGSICLHARRVEFLHPVSKELIKVEAPYPALSLWQAFQE